MIKVLTVFVIGAVQGSMWVCHSAIG
jgi:hypothetical protein